MANILIATLYIHQPIIAAATKISADRLILLIDEKSDENQQKALKLIQDSLGSVLEIKTVKTKTYDIVSIAEEAVKIIDLLSDKDQIYADVTAGRKTKAFGLLFGCYARIGRIKKIMYVCEEDKRIVSLPKVSYNLTDGQRKVVDYLASNNIKSLMDFSEKIDISRAMVYKYIKELKDMDIIEETEDGYKLTDYGRIVIL
ncbi:hypothetical protein COV16_06540 [Candidatus Woesearchaeota archaeon CG10_big_fil_rev_8_21_14_0_10_34_8]|nr:MAG: hypothetical protein COV16_06540 [Candidatus Woesearchaeota archaeon CG10_big_fil_rev_8_21_14_0_10_34_8]